MRCASRSSAFLMLASLGLAQIIPGDAQESPSERLEPLERERIRLGPVVLRQALTVPSGIGAGSFIETGVSKFRPHYSVGARRVAGKLPLAPLFQSPPVRLCRGSEADL
jgi:hypothetical protein